MAKTLGASAALIPTHSSPSVSPSGCLEQVDPVQATVVKLWLKSPVQGGSMVGAGGFKTVIGDGHGQTRHQTVGSLLSAKKMASVMKGLSPDYNKILTGMVFEFVRSQLHGSSAVYRSKRVCHEKSTN